MVLIEFKDGTEPPKLITCINQMFNVMVEEVWPTASNGKMLSGTVMMRSFTVSITRSDTTRGNFTISSPDIEASFKYHER